MIIPLFSIPAFSHNKIVELSPTLGQGYLVLYKTYYPNVDHWQITINKKTLNNDGTTNDSVVKQVNLPSGRNYWKVPSVYKINTSQQQYSFVIKGYSGQNKQIVSTISRNLYPAPPLCNCPHIIYNAVMGWKCIGYNYAWEIDQYAASQSGPSYFKLLPAYADTMGSATIPYYTYVPVNDLSVYCTQNNIPYNLNSDGTYNSPYLYGPIDASTGNYCDENGSPLTGELYGIAKGLGTWENSDIETSHLQVNILPRSLNWAITEINDYGDFTSALYPDLTLPPLTCTPAFCITQNPPIDSIVHQHNPPCNLSTIFTNDTCLSCFGNNIQTYINCLKKHLELGEPSVTLPFRDTNYIYINKIMLTDLNNVNKPPIVIHFSDIFKVDKGNRINVTNIDTDDYNSQTHDISLNPSLWCIGIVYNNGKYLPIIKEANSEISIHIPHIHLSHFIHAAISPVPIVNNHFTITIKSDMNLNVRYVLRDLFGNILFQQNLSLQKGVVETYNIHPNSQMPFGILFNRFVLDDGSAKYIETFNL